MAARSGARVLRSPAWLRTVRSCPEVAGLRADSRRTVLEVAAVLALAARADSTAAPTWPALIEASGYSRSTVAKVLAWLRQHRLLVTLENGSTPQFRPDPTRQRWRRDRPAPIEVEGNRAAVYLLTEPLPEPLPETPEQHEESAQCEHIATAKTAEQTSGQVSEQVITTLHRLRTPPHLSRRESVKNNPARASARKPTPAEPWWHASGATETAPRYAAGRSARMPGGESPVAGTSSPATDVNADPDAVRGEGSGQPTRGQRRVALVAVAEQLRTRALDLRPLSVAAVASVIREQVTQGWGVDDFVWAIDHTPDGTARTYTAGPISSSAPSLVVNGDQVTEVAVERRHRGVVADGGAPAARAVAYPAAWLRWRLAPWQGLAGPVAASRAAAVQRSAAAAAATAARRAEQAAAVAQAVPPPVVLAEARAALRARRTW